MRKSVIEKTLTCFREGSDIFPTEGLRIPFFALFMLVFTIMAVGAFYTLAKKRKRTGLNGRVKTPKAFDLLGTKTAKSIVRRKHFSFALRLLPGAILVLVIATGFLGRPRASLAAPFVWLFWWTALIFLVAFGGKLFCAICPWDFFANLFQYGIKPSKNLFTKATLNKKWPKSWKNVYPAGLFFIIITWLELGFNIAQNSFLTAALGAGFLLTATLTALVFEKRSFCRYLCPVGRISGIYALFSPLEVRPANLDVCASCSTKECVKGTDFSTPCPTGLIPYKLNSNAYCTLCTECVRSCDKANMTLRARPMAKDLISGAPPKSDEAALIFLVVALTFFHGMTMTSQWEAFAGSIMEKFGSAYSPVFTVSMACYLLLAWLFWKLLKRAAQILGRSEFLFQRLALSLVPATLGFHLAHNSGHFFTELGYLAPLLNDPFGWGWDLFGLKNYSPGPLISAPYVFAAAAFFLSAGVWYSFRVLGARVKMEPTSGLSQKQALMIHALYSLVILSMACVSLIFLLQPMAEKGA